VLANGHVYSADQALDVLAQTDARGLMVGRGAIRNPWLFAQIRQRLRGEPVTLPIGRDVLAYVRALWEAVCIPGSPEAAQVQRLKKFMNFLGEGVGSAGHFLHEIRRVETEGDFFRICVAHLDHDLPMELMPFSVTVNDRQEKTAECEPA
jgi:tRNA-dihydrouridine synthase